MLSDKPFTKENLDSCLKELVKEFCKKNGNKIPAEIVLIEFQEDYPGVLNGDNLANILKAARAKKKPKDL